MADLKKKLSGKAWVVAVDMGYGHQRAAFPLRELAPSKEIVTANNYPEIPEKDRQIWYNSKKYYDLISRFRRMPVVGKIVFGIFDWFQEIKDFYPWRDLSKPNFQLKQNFSLISRGWGKDLVSRLKERKLPIISTFFTPAFMAEFFNYPGEIYCLLCDTDVSRAWAPLNPRESKIKYLAPTVRAAERMKLYGVKPENIFLTGFPLPLENIGGKNLSILKKDLKNRLLNLDPEKRYFKMYKPLIEKYLGKMPIASDHPLTLMFAVGGAGAQKDLGIKIVKSLADKIKRGEMKIILVAGVRQEVKDYFEKELGRLGIKKNVEIIFEEKINDYFKKFNLALRKTDILWTKPSELSFYSALALPIIIAPPIGSQEKFNKQWLLRSGFGIAQENPKHTNQWLPYWLKRGYLAECAMEGFIEGEKLGTLNIKEIIL